MSSAVIVFARFPREGQVKTRLAATIGHPDATAYYKSCAEHLFGELELLDASITLHLYCADPADEELMRQWAGPRFHVHPQTNGNLGERMQSAFQEVFAHGVQRAVIVGTDIPDLTHHHIRDAFDLLHKIDVVLGPSHDGGYYLLGMKRLHPLFDGITWSTDSVARQTRELIGSAGLSLAELETLTDVDEQLP